MAASASAFFCYKYFRKQPVLQLPGLPPCQLTPLLSSLKLDIVLMWTNKKTHTNVDNR